MDNQFQGRIIAVNDWSKFHPWPTASALRHLIFNAKENGFNEVIRRIGRRVLINETEFFNWVQRTGVCDDA